MIQNPQRGMRVRWLDQYRRLSFGTIDSVRQGFAVPWWVNVYDDNTGELLCLSNLDLDNWPLSPKEEDQMRREAYADKYL